MGMGGLHFPISKMKISTWSGEVLCRWSGSLACTVPWLWSQVTYKPTWLHIPGISTFWTWRQEDQNFKSEVILSYVARSAWDTWDLVSKILAWLFLFSPSKFGVILDIINVLRRDKWTVSWPVPCMNVGLRMHGSSILWSWGSHLDMHVESLSFGPPLSPHVISYLLFLSAESRAEHQGGFGRACERFPPLAVSNEAMSISTCVWVSPKLQVVMHPSTRRDVPTINRVLQKLRRDSLKRYLPSNMNGTCHLSETFPPCPTAHHGVWGAASCPGHNSLALGIHIFPPLKALGKTLPCPHEVETGGSGAY